ncbi:MAG: hypothetical protein PHU25_09710, partial [Deltaproteobacteria bacterium]|nr:hypothetical protein [Deltaproteobacteria bacterium]
FGCNEYGEYLYDVMKLREKSMRYFDIACKMEYGCACLMLALEKVRIGDSIEEAKELLERARKYECVLAYEGAAGCEITWIEEEYRDEILYLRDGGCQVCTVVKVEKGECPGYKKMWTVDYYTYKAENIGKEIEDYWNARTCRQRTAVTQGK